ncbi:hypothetical protein [Evansella tamaricis]|uniref:ATP synthase F0 subunit 8 n=1 Tax=Evansella tamaricis TaxID=2069301 RepID=A0ABS6JME1_9BACI|nr:hypothetical protein [Evansella tamaricis]MBU9714831.1 hypothetical protein [Evansella tamaricis]
MTIFDLWVYKTIINTEIFVLIIIGFVFLFNCLGIVIMWFSLTEKKLKFQVLKKLKKATNKNGSTGPS